MNWIIISIALLSFWNGIIITEYTYMYVARQNSIRNISNTLDIISTGSFLGGIVCLLIWLGEII